MSHTPGSGDVSLLKWCHLKVLYLWFVGLCVVYLFLGYVLVYPGEEATGILTPTCTGRRGAGPGAMASSSQAAHSCWITLPRWAWRCWSATKFGKCCLHIPKPCHAEGRESVWQPTWVPTMSPKSASFHVFLFCHLASDLLSELLISMPYTTPPELKYTACGLSKHVQVSRTSQARRGTPRKEAGKR